MFNLFKTLFHDPDKESIEIFKRHTKLAYDEKLFSSFTVLSITHTELKNLNPFSVFKNLEMLNFSKNKISNIETLKELKKLKIIDLRFNQLTELPAWVFESELGLYWEREDEEQEGIFLQGNPLKNKLINRIKSRSKPKNIQSNDPIITPPPSQMQISAETSQTAAEQLYPLNTQHALIITAQDKQSKFLDDFLTDQSFLIHPHNQLRLNISLLTYDQEEKLNNALQIPQKIPYIILVLHKRECCIRPRILESLSQDYPHAKIFLIMENPHEDIEEKISFFKSYDKTLKIIDIFHSFDQASNQSIGDAIFYHIQNSQEVNSLWRASWIKLKEEIEQQEDQEISPQSYDALSQKYEIETPLKEMLWNYLFKIGSIKFPKEATIA